MYSEKFKTLRQECKATGGFFIWVVVNGLYNKLRGKNILKHQKVAILGLKNIQTSNKTLKIGLHEVGFTHKNERTLLNIKGSLVIKGNYTITQGCRLYIGEKGKLTIGNGGYVNAGCLFMIMNEMEIGENSIIAWNCQFVDDDFHTVEYEGKKTREKKIAIGNNVWVGSNCFVYKGVFIADGCVVAANSIVRHSCYEKNALIGGNPASVLKSNVRWNMEAATAEQ